MEPAIQLDEEQAIAVRELDPTAHLALQHDQLMPERGIFCFKSALGLEERGTQVQQEEYQARPSRPTLGDSVIKSKRTRFSAHTGVTWMSEQPLRIGTFNLESLDEEALSARIAVLRPELVRLRADILCLQEVNGQRPPRGRERRLAALSALIAETPYAAYQLVSTLTVDGDPAERHNLVILSRLPIVKRAQILHDLVERPLYRPATASPRSDRPEPIEWERPLLHAEIAVGPTSLHVINLHLRAPLAAPVVGQKLSPFSWRTVGGWAEGFFLAGMKRAGQALEARLLTEQLLDDDPDALVVVAGDLNADIYEVPLRILRAEFGDVGNAAVSSRALFPVEDVIPQAQRFTVLHHGRHLMLDHLLVSAKLQTYLTCAESLNQGLVDEADSAEQGALGGSFHAPLLAAFALPLESSSGMPARSK